MAILDPEHLFQQAESLTTTVGAGGAVRQVNLRRAISSAYYGLFHAVLTDASDMVTGKTKRGTSQYGLVYRSVDHRMIRELGEEITKSTLTQKYKPYAPASGFSTDIKRFASALLSLQQKRLEADYNPLVFIPRSDAKLAIKTARSALAYWNNASADQREAFLCLLLFRVRP